MVREKEEKVIRNCIKFIRIQEIFHPETIKNCWRYSWFGIEKMNDIGASFDQNHATNDLLK